MNKDRIREELFALQDKKYRDFQAKLIPTVDPETVIGVRTPQLRKLAKRLYKETDPAGFWQLHTSGTDRRTRRARAERQKKTGTSFSIF